MGKIRFMADEFFRSFLRSLCKDMLLMAMFSVSLVMAVIMCSYYFDLGERYSFNVPQIGDSKWYGTMLTLEGEEEFSDSMNTLSGCRKVMDYYETLTTLEEYPLFCINTYQGIFLKKQDMELFFGGRDYSSFLPEDNNAPVSGYWGERTALIQGVQGAQVSLDAYRYFGIQVQEGEGFTEQNLEIAEADDPIPILVGSNYKGILDIGTEIELLYWGRVYPCRVTGILKAGTQLPKYRQFDEDMCSMDSVIVYPFGIKLKSDPKEVEKIEKYAWNNYIALDFGYSRVRDDRKVKDQVAVYRDIGEEFGFPPLHLTGPAMGIELLRKESDSNIQTMFVLTVALIGFSFYGLAVTFYDKIHSNRRNYGIYLMNGCPLYMIVLPCLAEIALILFPGILMGWVVFSTEALQIYKIGAIMRAACGLAGVAFLAGAAALTFMMRGVDTEYLLRRKD